MKKNLFVVCAVSFSAMAFAQHDHSVADSVIQNQRLALENNTADQGYGPQAPRDIDQKSGSNQTQFNLAPDYQQMNLCNIHFHENAEHKGGDFTLYAGNGDGHGYGTGYQYNGKLTQAELTPVEVAKNAHGSLVPGDTIEVHYVYSTADVTPGPTLAACLSKATSNPQLRVEAQVFVLVNDTHALNFVSLTENAEKQGYQQALNIPAVTPKTVEYIGSTTGPGYNEKGSPFQVTWSVRPEVLKVDINSVGQWLTNNIYKENHAHGVRNLVTNPKLLSPIK